MNMTLEVVTIPVSDVDRAKDFYEHKLGFHVDMDVRPTSAVRFVQLTPPGSNCSIHIGEGITDMTPGIVKDVILVVESAKQARADLEAKGVELGKTEEMGWGKHISLSDPDGNLWVLQESYARSKQKR
jgi:catechol 2,3-dioxygenase-like lactoylglutathione lyase family enzyme